MLYDERDDIVIINIDRPEKNAVTSAVIQGIADGIDAARRSADVVGTTGGDEPDLRFRHIPANHLALNKLLVNKAYENMGLWTSQMLDAFLDGVIRHAEEAHRWAESFDDSVRRGSVR